MNLSKLKDNDLIDLKEQIEVELLKRHLARHSEMLLDAIGKERRRSSNVNLNSVFTQATKSTSAKKKNYPAKYANPDNPQETWTGLGRKPLWVRNLTGNLEDALIQQPKKTPLKASPQKAESKSAAKKVASKPAAKKPTTKKAVAKKVVAKKEQPISPTPTVETQSPAVPPITE